MAFRAIVVTSLDTVQSQGASIREFDDIDGAFSWVQCFDQNVIVSVQVYFILPIRRT
jgi:hypothetical protein